MPVVEKLSASRFYGVGFRGAVMPWYSAEICCWRCRVGRFFGDIRLCGVIVGLYGVIVGCVSGFQYICKE